MNLAVLGTDDDVMALIAAADAAGHRVVWLADPRPQDTAAIAARLPHVSPAEHWEGVLDHALADAVIVGQGTVDEDQRLERLKKLVADEIRVLAVFPIGASVLGAYELDMIRRETGCWLRRYAPHVDAPWWDDVARWTASGHEEIGRIHQVAVQSTAASHERRDVLAALARDADLLLRIAGEIRKASAIGVGQASHNYAGLDVQLTGAGDEAIHWRASVGDEPWRMTLFGERGQIVLSFHVDGDPAWQCEISAQGHVEHMPLAPWDSAAAAIAELAQAAGANRAENPQNSNWDAATRAMEVVDAVDLSLQRGRSIEVFHQQLTQQLAFRGVMSALGCGLLLVCLLLLVMAGMVGDAVNIPVLKLLVREYWPLTLLGVLALFLVMQLVPWVAGDRNASRRPYDRSQ